VRVKQNEIERQKERYRGLFEHVPCYITVQNRAFELEAFNQMFADEFTAVAGDPCYRAFKGRETPCDICPVADSFADGKSHLTEVVFTDANGVDRHLYVNTMAIPDEDGRIASVMEISLDISSLKYLEEELERSRKKYLAIFSHIPHSLSSSTRTVWSSSSATYGPWRSTATQARSSSA
jgi:histidine kinase